MASSSSTPSTSSSAIHKGTWYNEAYPSSDYGPAVAASVYAKVVRQSAAGIIFVNGFDCARKDALELVTQLMTSYMLTICHATKLNCEMAGRTVPIPTDVWLGLVNMGHRVDVLPEFLRSACRAGSLVIPPPKVSPSPSNNPALRVGKARPHPAHVAEFLPPFPDPHTYIRTEISGEPDVSYEKVRELHAQRKRDTETLLVNYFLRVHPRTCLFREYENKVKQEAQNAISDRERQKEAIRAARKHAKAQEKLKNAVKAENLNDLPENLMEEDILENDAAEPMAVDNQGPSPSDDEMDFELDETETSLVLRRIPAYCSILDPSLESRPYLSALVSEEILEDESTETASSGAQNNQSSREGDEQVYDNAFLRPPRMPAKGNFVQF